ncbi:MAG: hypothetical protein OEM77_00460 [Nitrosopumilus sp.]|nr:hypothetical protein [Nitrosopumilus sp.]MDH3736362.1 hypothetical protein [Nitrosopumilus sp.]MDH3822321.1 hypothetical protein [Nitrosopumilus sp.]MDH3834410.1 hypothetical protein [Nitrosopumilus sp.]
MKTTPTDGLVNVNRYTIYAMIPGLDTYVASKLDKKKFATIYTVIFMTAILAATVIVMYNMSFDPELTSEMNKTERADMVYEKFMPQIVAIILGSIVIHIPIYTYLVRKWAKEWNENISRGSKK